MNAPVVVGISGASGAIYGIRLLRALKDLGVPRHLIVSAWGARTIALETDWTLEAVRALADKTHDDTDMAVGPASGSFSTRGMVVAPCSVKTLSAVAHSYGESLIARAADVTLKERRPLILTVRETPLHKGHIELMAKAADLGAVILPPVPAFYHRPESIEDLVRHTVARMLDALGIEHALSAPWGAD